VPALGLGTWQMSGPECVAAVSEAIGIGYRHIDTAQMYGNEAEVGEGIRDSGVDPAELFVSTKLGSRVLTPADVRLTTEESLRRLGLDRVDLLLVHQPVAERRLDLAVGVQPRGLRARLGQNARRTIIERDLTWRGNARRVLEQMERLR